MDITRWPDLDGIENADLEGYLVKGTGMIRTKKRYFVLDGIALQYFASDAMTDMKGEVDIRDAQLSIFSGATGKGYFFELLVPQHNAAVPGSMRRYTVNAATQAERAQWCRCLAQNILSYRARFNKTLTSQHLQWKVVYDAFKQEPATCVFEGWLLKGTGFKAKRRFCRLMSNLALVYFAKENDLESTKGVISLVGATVDAVGDAVFGILINGGDKTTGGGADATAPRSVDKDDAEGDDESAQVAFQFKAPSTERRDAWVEVLRTTVRAVVEVGGSTNTASANYDPKRREYVIATLADIAKGPERLLEIYNEHLALRPPVGEMLFGPRIHGVKRVQLEQYVHPVPKALVMLWQALVHKGAGVRSEGIFRVTGSKEDIATDKNYICGGAWSKKRVGGALVGVFDADSEWWASQEHPRDAFCAGNLIKMWFRDLSPKLLDGVDLDGVRFTKPDAAQVLEGLLGVDECNTYLWLLDRCLEVEHETDCNRMTKRALATVFVPNLFSDIATAIQDGADFFVQSLQWRSRHFGGDHRTGVVGQPPLQVLVPEDDPEDEDSADDDLVAGERQPPAGGSGFGGGAAAAGSPSAKSVASLDDEEWERTRGDSGDDAESPKFAYRPSPTAATAGGHRSVFADGDEDTDEGEFAGFAGTGGGGRGGGAQAGHSKLTKRTSGSYLSSKLRLKTPLGLVDLTREQLQAIEDFRAGLPAPSITQREGVDAMSFGLFVKTKGGVENEVVLNMGTPTAITSPSLTAVGSSSTSPAAATTATATLTDADAEASSAAAEAALAAFAAAEEAAAAKGKADGSDSVGGGGAAAPDDAAGGEEAPGEGQKKKKKPPPPPPPTRPKKRGGVAKHGVAVMLAVPAHKPLRSTKGRRGSAAGGRKGTKGAKGKAATAADGDVNAAPTTAAAGPEAAPAELSLDAVVQQARERLDTLNDPALQPPPRFSTACKAADFSEDEDDPVAPRASGAYHIVDDDSSEEAPPPPPPKKPSPTAKPAAPAAAAGAAAGGSGVKTASLDARIAELVQLKKAAVDDEDFMLAKRYKDEIEKLESASALDAQIAALEAEKRQAVDEEDFLRASQVKAKILALKAQQQEATAGQ